MENKHSTNIIRALAFIFILMILGFVIFSLFWGVEPLKGTNLVKEMEYSINQIHQISLDINTADVNIIMDNIPNLKIEQYSNLQKKKQKEFVLENENGAITVKDNNSFSFSPFKPWTWDKEVYYNIYVPISYQQDLKVKIEEGDVSVTSSRSSSQLRNVNLSLITGDFINDGYLRLEEFKLEGITGDVHLGEMDANHIKIKTITGDIKGDKVNAAIDIGLTTGDVSLNKTLFKVNSKISTVTGDIYIYLTEEIVCTFSSKTTLGDINIERKTIGRGTYQVTLKTTTGDIKVK